MRRRRKNRKQVRMVVGLSICLLLIMTVGYAAFSTNLTITAKGNIHNLTTIDNLKSKVVTEGDGLYIDTYEEGRYIYRGGNPNNYIKFSNELYRIVALEKDGTVKIVKDDYMTAVPFDKSAERRVDGGYCSGIYDNNYCGCNAWGSNTSMRDSSGNLLQSLPSHFGSSEMLPLNDKEADVNVYLNNNFYNSINADKKYIVNHNFYVGVVTIRDADYPSLKDTISQEKAFQWNGKIGLISISDYVRGSTNEYCSIQTNFGGTNGCESGSTVCGCAKDNYLYKGTVLRTLSPTTWNDPSKYSTNRCVLATVVPDRSEAIITITASSSSTGYQQYYPSFYISASKFLGSGTETDPYIIKS